MGGDVTWGNGPDDSDLSPPRSYSRGASPPAPAQFPVRPYDPRQFPMRPYDPRQFPVRPYGPRQFPVRPYGPRQFPVRPYGGRQFPVRPYEDGDQPTGYLDPTEWSCDVSDLFCAESALIRLGARVVTGDCDISVLAVEPLEEELAYGAPFQQTTASDKEPRPLARRADKKLVAISRSVLSPSHEVAVRVAIPDHLARNVAEDAELAWALKQDVAHTLANAADRAFLSGPRDRNCPVGISSTQAVPEYGSQGQDPLKTARGIVSALRTSARVRWGNAGWILHPHTLDALTRLVTVNALREADQGRSLDSRGAPQLLAMDGHDGGTFLGYPFVISTAARDAGNTRIFFSCDWSEAWIAVDRAPVTIDISVDAKFQQDETVIRAVMRHDIAVRRPAFFRWATKPRIAPAWEIAEQEAAAQEEQEKA